MTTIRQMAHIITAMLAMTGRVTMLGLSRWAGKGGSYRTVQRFYHTVLPWPLLFWWFFRTQLYRADDVYLLVGDECVTPKAGKQTHGLDRFFSSLYGKPIPGVAFFTLGLVNTRERRAYPLQVEQLQARSSCKGASVKPAAAASRPVGRPKGSKNRDKTQVTLTPELQLIQNMVRKQGLLINGLFPLTYLVLDGQFGNHNALAMTRHGGLHLISKLRGDAALYLPYRGPYQGRGPHRKYGERLDYRHLPSQYCKSSVIEDNIQTDTYQMQVWHESFPALLNVVILVKTNLKTGAQAHVILFSSDLTLSYEQLVDYYSLRFQIEDAFNIIKRLLGLAYFWTGSVYGILLQVWATWLVYGILVNLTDAVAEALERPFQDVSLEMVFHGLYYFQQARQRGEATELIAYLAANATWLGILKQRCKGAKTKLLALTGSANP